MLGLSEMHGRNVAHRDSYESSGNCRRASVFHAFTIVSCVDATVSLENVLVEKHGTLKISDFGVAIAMCSEMPAARDRPGKYQYMSPEVLSVHMQLSPFSQSSTHNTLSLRFSRAKHIAQLQMTYGVVALFYLSWRSGVCLPAHE